MKTRLTHFIIASLLSTLIFGCGGSSGTSSAASSTTGSKRPLISGGSYLATWQYGNMRDGSNSNETTLTISNVNKTSFGRLFTQALDAITLGQPLYVPSVKIKGVVHNTVYVCTENNSVYAFDADSNTGSNAQPLWKVNLGPAAPLGTEDAGNEPLDGILSTPVIQYTVGTTATGVLYVCDKTMTSGTFHYTLHGLDITTGSETAGGPEPIAATVPGKLGPITLDVKNSYQRPALLLNNNTVYVAIGGQAKDPEPDRGWVVGFNASNIKLQTAAFTSCADLADSSTPEKGGAFWMSGAGPACDGTSIYLTTGNGDFNANTGGADYGDSILKLNSSLKVTSYFSPFNTTYLEDHDLDLGCGGPILIPSQAGSPPLLLQESKTNELYIANTNSLGGFNATTDQIYQEEPLGLNREYLCTCAYCNGYVYLIRGYSLQEYAIKTGKLQSKPSATASTVFGAAYSPTPVVSYSGNSTPVVWAMQEYGSTAILHAFDAVALREIYNSGQDAPRDAAGKFTKFAVPLVMAGKVYVPCANEIAVYGLLSSPAQRR
ncbi:MAG TPA: hypothetical protein VGL56_10405 [Fimbriimonadaceae bacterium]